MRSWPNKSGIARICACGADYSFRHYLATSCCKCAANKIKERDKATGAALAHATIARAIKGGSLTPAKEHQCVDCGNKARDYDHRDYGKPLEVAPVCRSCNKLRGPAKPIVSIWPDLQEKAAA